MAKVAFILLTHKDPAAVIDQARRLVAGGDFVAIHHDGRAPQAEFAAIREALSGEPSVVFAPRRHRCGWGEWSLVAATLEALRAAEKAFPAASHFYMLSGDCMPIKTAEYVHAFLDAEDRDYIEHHDFMKGDWIKTGLKEERLIYRHYFNERRHKRLFYLSLALQQRLGLRRKVPDGLHMRIGSQWWCLRRTTVEAVLALLERRPEIVRFFRTTWIPDESFFQTLVPHLVPRDEIENRTLTFLMFSDYGLPVVFYNDHYDMLIAQDQLFARKISPEALELKARLGRLYARAGVKFDIAGNGVRLYGYLAGRGREGRRFAPRFWEADTTLGPENELLMVVCKKWHVAKRLAGQIRETVGMPALGYLFNEIEAGLPDLGGLASTVGKRHRHRRLLLRLLFDYFGTHRLVICLDPSSLDLIEDFSGDRARTRLLELRSRLTDEFLIGHAQRLGLASPAAPPPTLAPLLQTLRNDIEHESWRLRERRLPFHEVIGEGDAPAEVAATLARFLSVPQETVERIAAADLFAD